MRQFLVFLLTTLILSLVLFTILIIPVTYHYANTIPERTHNVEKFLLNADVNATGPIELVAQPHIVLDLEANGSRSSFITLSRQSIIYPKYLLFGTAEFPWDEVRDLKQQTAERDRLVTGIIIFLLPSLLFWFFLVSFVLCGLLFLLMLLAAYLLPRVFRHRIRFTEAVKVAIISLPSLLLFGLGLYPLAVITVVWVAFGLTLVVCGIAITIISEPDMPTERHKHHGKV